MNNSEKKYVLAFDTANEMIAVGIGEVHDATEPNNRRIECISHVEVQAHRQSNTQLLSCVDKALNAANIERKHIAAVACGAGPGSFTGVRIALATAKGISTALSVGLIGIPTLDAVACVAHEAGIRGNLRVVADAMRHEVYVAKYSLDEREPTRQSTDSVIAVSEFENQLQQEALQNSGQPCTLTGDSLTKYGDGFHCIVEDVESKTQYKFAPQNAWHPTGSGLLFALQSLWRANECDIFNVNRHHPALVLPLYTRLSDAEENERNRLAHNSGGTEKKCDHVHKTMNDMAINNARGGASGYALKPLDKKHVPEIAALEATLMGSDAWSTSAISDELDKNNRIWWIALECNPDEPVRPEAKVVGYAGALVVGDDAEILKIATSANFQRRGVARALLSRVAEDARSLGAKTLTLEVRKSNNGAQAFYESRGFERVGLREHYYSDSEAAIIMQANISHVLAATKGAVGGMQLESDGLQPETNSLKASNSFSHPLIFAIETSCDETAASIIDGEGKILSSVVASQVDFHARFGGVVPEIASRKHIEAICGVALECLERASTPQQTLTFANMDAFAATYAPGLLGALVVGVAFAKGAAWGTNKPYIKVNHLEGHLYANKIDNENFNPPALVSLVSGGNTLLVHMLDWGNYKTIGYTIDDAVGEAFDKVAKALGLGYPGGPVISKMAATGNPQAIKFPRAMMHSGDYRFSLSGLKTAVVNYINNERCAGNELNVPDICASFTSAVVDVQVEKAKRALLETGVSEFCLGGGVAANPSLREAYERMCKEIGVHLTLPPLSACGDNAAMIALVAHDRFKQEKFSSLTSDAKAQANIDEEY